MCVCLSVCWSLSLSLSISLSLSLGVCVWVCLSFSFSFSFSFSLSPPPLASPFSLSLPSCLCFSLLAPGSAVCVCVCYCNSLRLHAVCRVSCCVVLRMCVYVYVHIMYVAQPAAACVDYQYIYTIHRKTRGSAPFLSPLAPRRKQTQNEYTYSYPLRGLHENGNLRRLWCVV
jgi:hypothetical protein